MTIVPRVSLAELLTLERRPTNIIHTAQYAEIGVYSYGRGIFHKRPRSGLEVGDKDLFAIREGDFIIQLTFAWEGAVAVASAAENGMYGSVRFLTFRVDEGRCDPRYLLNYFRTREGVDQLVKISPGSAGRNRVLNVKRIPEVSIPLPPLDEQLRIVSRIEELASKIEVTRGLVAARNKETRSLLASAVEAVLAGLSGVNETIVSEIAESVTDGDHQPPPKSDSGIPFIFINHIANGRLNFTGCNWVSKDYFRSLSPTRVPRSGDVLYTAVGSYGIPCLVETDQPFCFQRHIAIIRPDRSRILPSYLKWALSSRRVFEQATKAATGSAQLTVPLRAIRELRFPLPTIESQRGVVSYLDELQTKVDSVKKLQSETSAELDALMPSILDKAFRGDL